MTRVGEEVKRLREELGWTQPRLAVEAGVAVSAVSQIENGRRSPNVGTLEKLAEGLDVEVADLFPKAQASLPLGDDSEQRRASVLSNAPSPSRSPSEVLDRQSFWAAKEKIEAGQVKVAAKEVSDALASYIEALIRAYKGDLDDPKSPHFQTATTAALWGEMLHRESKMLMELFYGHSWAIIGALAGSAEQTRWAVLMLVRSAGMHLARFNKMRQLADERIAGMRGVPDELPQKRLEKARHEAEESAHCLEELQKTAGQA